MAQSSADPARIDDIPRPQRRRRWVAILALLCVLLATAVATVWSVDRPLTDVEQRLVGTWRNTTSPAAFTFHPDRTVTSPGFPRGVWQVRENTLNTADSGMMGALQTLLRKGDLPCELTFEGDDNISVIANGGTHQWQRVPVQ